MGTGTGYCACEYVGGIGGGLNSGGAEAESGPGELEEAGCWAPAVDVDAAATGTNEVLAPFRRLSNVRNGRAPESEGRGVRCTRGEFSTAQSGGSNPRKTWGLTR